VLVVCDRPAPDWTNLADEILPIATASTGVTQDLRPITDVVVGQLIGLFACLSRGLKPDAPSRSGVIARVVPGFTLH
jgi:tagatose-6-phosphate ketose/aldose isomerase